MICVIIAGGSGTRLWPLSTPDYPKHLLSLTGRRSLLQHTYRRAATISNDIYVLTDASHAKHVKEQLPQLVDDAFIIEPGRRGTASCIVAALHHISTRHSKNEPIAFLAADHYIRDTAGFTHSFKVAEVAAEKDSRIVLIGVEPDYPATGFGYIQKNGLFDEKSFVFNVHSFKEKPPYDVASEYVKSGNYLWNCGYFVGSLNAFVRNMKDHAPQLYENYQALGKTKGKEQYARVYLGFEANTIDYALIENVDDLLVVPATFDWMDLGSYGDVHKAVESDELGNYVRGDRVEIEDVQNSFIHDDQNKPLAVIGLDNIVVVNTAHGIIVARKDMSQKIGEVSKRFEGGKST